MKKYYIGLLVLSALVVGLLCFTLYQGSLSKKDKVVQDRAVEIAEDLNNYVAEQNKIPSTLASADIDDVPEAISYKKLSESRYEFCVTYQTLSRGYGVGTSELVTTALAQSYMSGFYGEDSDYEAESLYISTYGHEKGEDCQTVKPYLSSFDDETTDYESELCDPESSFYEFYKDYCDEDSGSIELDTQEN